MKKDKIVFNDSLGFIRKQREKLDNEFFSDPRGFKKSLKYLGDAWRAEHSQKKKAA